MEIKIAHLHNPLFFAGINFGIRLDPGKRIGLKLEFDAERNWLVVRWNKQKAYIPLANVSAMEEGKPEAPLEQIHHPMVAGVASAQVETPYGHVHAGPGMGKTGKSK